MADAVERLWAVVPAGGAGTRLWPLSRAASPKFLHDLTGSGRTLLQATVDRLLPLVGERILVVTGAAHQAAVRRQLPDLAPAQVIAEPAPRDSMAAIGLAAATIERDDPTGIIGSFAADHVIRGRGRLPGGGAGGRRGGRHGAAGHDRDRADGAGDRLRLRPRGRARWPASRRRGRSSSSWRSPTRSVRGPTSRRGTTAGTPACSWPGPPCCWTCSPSTVPSSPPGCARSRPTRRRSRTGGPGWRRSRSTTRSPSRPQRPAGWRRCPGASAGTTSVTSARSPTCCRPRPTACRCWAIRRRWWSQDSTGLVVPSGDRVVAVLGLEDVVVVDTGDALLVASADRAQDVKAVVDLLRERGRGEV